jgi:DNA-binding GntR family transcriptional regulator
MLKQKSLGEMAYQQLLNEIINGDRPAGEKLVEDKIASELGISRTPAREALLRLIHEGFVEQKPRCGCTVKLIDKDMIRDAFTCRQLLECCALELSFDTISIEDVQPALTLLRQSNEICSINEQEAAKLSLEADELMHQLIRDRCPNQQLQAFILNVQNQTKPYRQNRTWKKVSIKEVNAERYELLSSIAGNHKNEALEFLKMHILNGIEGEP